MRYNAFSSALLTSNFASINKKKDAPFPARLRELWTLMIFITWWLHHATHATHAMVMTMAGLRLFLFREIRDQALGGQQKAGY